MIAVLEAQPLAVTAGVGQFGEDGGVDGGGPRSAQHRHGEGVQRADPAPQPARQDLFQLGERADGGLADAVDALPGRRAQPYGHRDGLVVVQEQRRQLGPGAELVTAARTRAGVDGIAQLAQPLHVTADGARGDAQPPGEIRARPLAVGLEQ